MDGTTTTTNGGAGEEQWAADAPASEQPQLLATAVGDQCANCGARLAGDQRYCVECGERRGKPRYSLSGSGASAGSSAPSRRLRRPRMSANTSLIAGIGVLLLAMGVGVLIGRTSAGTQRNQYPVIRVPAAAAGPTGATTAGTPTTSSTPTSTSARSSSPTSSSKAKSPAAAISAKLPTAAKKIPKKLQSSVAKQGSKCKTGTVGCKDGTYGSFFGH